VSRAAALRRVSRAAACAAFLALALPAAASAEVFVVAPSSTRTETTCSTATPCEYVWAVQNAKSGDVVQFESGEYDYVGGPVHEKPLEVNEGVTLEQAPGDATRPLIKQTSTFKCACATMMIYGGAVRGLAIEQAHGTKFTGPEAEGGAGAVAMSVTSVVEHAVLAGAYSGMYFFNGAPGATGGLRDTVVTAANGIAIAATEIPRVNLDNVTAIAHGSLGGGVALAAGSNGEAMTLEVTNTILRGDVYDIEDEERKPGAPATVNLHYSDARPAKELKTGSLATISEDHPTHGEPLFVSPTDLREALGSPTIDTGAADAASGLLDLAGLPRTIGPAADIGAYEFQGIAPSATTGAPSAVGQAGASLAGTVGAGDLTSTWYFNYGPTTAYGSRTGALSLPGLFATQPVAATLAGLKAGSTYHYQLVATNGLGTATGADATFTTAAAPVTPPPSDRALRLSRTRFRVASAGGTVSRARPSTGTDVSYSDTQAGTSTLSVLAPTPGVRIGHACSAPPRRRVKGRRYRRCVRYVKLGSFTHADSAGANRLHFTGRLRGRRLPPGSYRLSATPRNGLGVAGATVSAGFTVIR
jgi:hypothetical protein